MVKSTTLPPEQKSPKPYVPGSLNPTTFPTRDVSGPGISHRPSVGSIDFFTEAGKSLKQTIYNADIKPVSETLKAEVMYSTLKILDAESLVSLPSHVYSFLYTKYNGTANMSIQEGTIGQPQILEVRASIDYHDTFCAVPSVHLGTEQTSLDYTSADMIRASSLPRFYDVITTSSKPKPGDIITVQYTDSNPRTSGIIVSHVASVVATASNSPHQSHQSAGTSSTVGSLAPSQHASTTSGGDKKEIQNIYFSGKCNRCSPEQVRKDHDFSAWESINGVMLILSYKDKNYEYKGSGSLKKIIGFSAGAEAAYNLHKRHPEAQLVFIDPWVPTDFKQPENFEYKGTSCFIARRANEKRLKVLGKVCDEGTNSFNDHLGYFKKYFGLRKPAS